MKNEFQKRVHSFQYAIRGFIWALRTQRNLQIHFVALILVVILGILLSISNIEWLVICICFVLVISTELLNSAIENLTDIVSPEFSKDAGRVKDIAASAVLFSAFISAIIGLIIFVPKILQLF